MKTIKKPLSILLALMMILSVFAVLPLTVNAVGGKVGDCDWEFDEATGKLSITGVGDPSRGRDCPWSEYESQITSVYIGDGATATPINIGSNIYVDNVTSVEIGDSVKKIGWNAFSGCSKLKTIKIGSGVKEIQDEAFYECKKLATVKFGSGVKTIGKSAFYNCYALKSISIPDSVTRINESAFLRCLNLEKVSIGKGVKYIGSAAFSYCKSMKAFSVNKSNAKYSSASGSLFNKKKTSLLCYASGRTAKKYTVSKTVKTIASLAFSVANKVNEINTNKVVTIKNEAFYNCGALKKVVLGDSLKKMENDAFAFNSKLATVSIGKKLNMKSNCFGYCEKVKKITVSKKNKNMYVSKYGLYNKKAKSLVVAFNLKSKPNFTVKSGITSVTADAFYCSQYLKSLVLPKSVKKVGDEIFVCCKKLTKLTVYNSKLDLSYSYLGVDGDELHIRTNITVVCYKGSEAAKYAKSYGFKVQYL